MLAILKMPNHTDAICHLVAEVFLISYSWWGHNAPICQCIHLKGFGLNSNHKIMQEAKVLTGVSTGSIIYDDLCSPIQLSSMKGGYL